MNAHHIYGGAEVGAEPTRDATSAPKRSHAGETRRLSKVEGYGLRIDDGQTGGDAISRPSTERVAVAGERQPDQSGVQGGHLSLWLLRGGLAFVFIYAAAAMASNPAAFVAYVPEGLWASPWAHRLLFVVSGFEVLLAVGLLWRRFTSVASLMAAAMMVGIIFLNLSSFDVLFRNVAIGCAALSLALQTRTVRPTVGDASGCGAAQLGAGLREDQFLGSAGAERSLNRV